MNKEMNWNLQSEILDRRRVKIINFFTKNFSFSNIKGYFMIFFMEGFLKGIEIQYIDNNNIDINKVIKDIYNSKKDILKEFKLIYKKYGKQLNGSICQEAGFQYGKEFLTKKINYYGKK